jgi:flagellar basal-body rod protein FlgG
MIRGIYTAGAGMRQKLVAMEVVANNLANINTAGFKRDDIFARLLDEHAAPPDPLNADGSGLELRRFTDHTEGSLEQTNHPFHAALQGPGFFALDTPNGTRYTRNGRFTLSTDGTLVNEQGFAVQGINGNIRVQDAERLSAGDIAIGERGDVSQNGRVLGRLRIVNFEDLTQLNKEEDATFRTDAKEQQLDLDTHITSIRQGFLEESNVDGIEEMVAMIELSRNFESNQRALQSQDSTIERSLEVGRL